MSASLLVVVPALNEEKLISNCLTALEKQTAHASTFRVVVSVDSRTCDATVEICRRHSCEIRIDDTYHTIGGALKIAAAGMTEDFIAGTEADCEVARNWIEVILTEFSNDAALQGMTGPVRALEGARLGQRFSFSTLTATYRALGFLLRRAFFPGMNYAYRRECFQSVGGFNQGLSAGWDNDLSIRASRANSVRFFPHLIVNTSARRLQAGLIRNCFDYGLIFLQVNLGMATSKPKDIR